jgi:8-oxo-dGTP pyrophosphatase MutT (NUDIX family)
MPTLELIQGTMSRYEPTVVTRPHGGREAAVALIVRERSGSPEILFIERALREGDPWSGHMAFPGGRREPADPDLPTTAVRETFEEVGVELAEPIGRLDEVDGTRGLINLRLVVAPFVFTVERPATVSLSPEVQDTVWVPVSHLLDPASSVHHRLEREGLEARFPAIRYERYTIWGLTYRILGRFFEILGKELPAPEPG